MTVTHFTTVTNSPHKSRAVEISCSTPSEWSVESFSSPLLPSASSSRSSPRLFSDVRLAALSDADQTRVPRPGQLQIPTRTKILGLPQVSDFDFDDCGDGDDNVLEDLIHPHHQHHRHYHHDQDSPDAELAGKRTSNCKSSSSETSAETSGRS